MSSAAHWFAWSLVVMAVVLLIHALVGRGAFEPKRPACLDPSVCADDAPSSEGP